MKTVFCLIAWKLLIHTQLCHVCRIYLSPANALQSNHLSPSNISWCLLRHSGVRWPCIAWQSNKFGFVQCSHPIDPNGILYLTEVSEPPYPFVSTGNLTIYATDKKTTFFRELSLYPQVIGVPTGPKDINILFINPRKDRWTRNRVFRYR